MSDKWTDMEPKGEPVDFFFMTKVNELIIT